MDRYIIEMHDKIDKLMAQAFTQIATLATTSADALGRVDERLRKLDEAVRLCASEIDDLKDRVNSLESKLYP